MVAKRALLVMVAMGTTIAHAEPSMMRRHRILLGAERLVPLYSYSQTVHPFLGGSSGEVSSSIAIFGYDTAGAGFDVAQYGYYTTPRLAADVVLTDHLTVGTSALVFVTTSRTNTVTNGSTGASMTMSWPRSGELGVAPRIGYVVPLTCSLALWPRAGVSYYYSWTKAVQHPDYVERGSHTDQWAFDGDVLLAWQLADHFALTAGAVADIPLSGSSAIVGAGVMETEVEQWQIGLTGGLVGWF